MRKFIYTRYHGSPYPPPVTILGTCNQITYDSTQSFEGLPLSDFWILYNTTVSDNLWVKLQNLPTDAGTDPIFVARLCTTGIISWSHTSGGLQQTEPTGISHIDTEIDCTGDMNCM